MRSRTKIVVLRQKNLMAGIIILAIIAAIILAFLGAKIFRKPESTTTSGNGIYVPGVYTSSVIINGSPMEIRLTVDENNINDIELLNVSEAITTMYPLIENSFNDIKKQVIEKGTTSGISFQVENTYSSTTLLNAIDIVLYKCKKLGN